MKIEVVKTLDTTSQTSRRRTKALLITLLTAAFAITTGLFIAHSASGTTITPGNLPSWNPNVGCHATSATVHQVIGNHFNSSTQGALESGGPFGVLNGTDESSLHPPCMAQNVNGTINPTFVEIHGISLTGNSVVQDGTVGGKCGTKYTSTNGGGPYPGGRTFCNAYGVFQDTLEYTGNCETLQDPNPKICIRLEIDRDWMAAGYCGTGTVCDNSTFDNLNPTQKIDVQGFVAWHPPSSPGHGYSAWELHPLTAWRMSNSSTPDLSITANPSSLSIQQGSSATSLVTIHSAGGFSGNVILAVGTSPAIANTTQASLNPASVMLSSGSSATSTLTVQTSHSTPVGSYNVNVKATSGSLVRTLTISLVVTAPPADFSISASPASMTIGVGSSGTATVALNSLYNFAGTVNLSATVTPIDSTGSLSLFDPSVSFSPTSVALAANGSGASTMSVSSSVLTLPGTYQVTIMATSGAISHSAIVTVTVSLV
jgi:hypothetical protein